MTRHVSKPIELGRTDVSRADLVFYGVDHSGPSYEARVFFNNPEADENTPRDPEHGYAGSFHIFGHGGCFGEEGHCEIPQTRELFDLRPAHQLTPAIKSVIVTEALHRHAGEGPLTITVLGVAAEEPDSDPLRFERISLLVYQEPAVREESPVPTAPAPGS
jgi:tyrosinase